MSETKCTCPALREAQHLILGYKYLLRRARRELLASPLRETLNGLFGETEQNKVLDKSEEEE